MATTTRPDPSAGLLRSTSPIPLRPAVPSSTPVPATRLGRIPLSRPRPSTPDPRFRPSAFSGEAVPFQITAFREGHDRIGVHVRLVSPSGAESLHRLERFWTDQILYRL